MKSGRGKRVDESVFKQFNHTVALLYQVQSAPETWLPFLSAFRDLLAAETVSIALGDPFGEATTLVCNSEGAHCIEDGSIRAMLQLSPFSELLDGQVVKLSELIPHSQLEAHHFYQQCMAPFGFYHMMGANLWSEDHLLAYFRLARPRAGSAFSDDEQLLCEQLLPHLKQALAQCRLMDSITPANSLWQQQLERLGWGEVLLDRQGKILSLSETAEEFLSEKTSPLRNRNGYLKAQKHDLQSALSDRLDDVVAKQATTVVRLPDAAGVSHWQLLLYPKRGVDQYYLVAYLHREQSALKLSPETLKQLFSLTQAESMVCIALAKGMSVEEIADENSLSQNTVRSHIRIAMAKIGVNRQAALVSKIFMSVAISGS